MGLVAWHLAGLLIQWCSAIAMRLLHTSIIVLPQFLCSGRISNLFHHETVNVTHITLFGLCVATFRVLGCWWLIGVPISPSPLRSTPVLRVYRLKATAE